MDSLLDDGTEFVFSLIIIIILLLLPYVWLFRDVGGATLLLGTGSAQGVALSQ